MASERSPASVALLGRAILVRQLSQSNASEKPTRLSAFEEDLIGQHIAVTTVSESDDDEDDAYDPYEPSPMRRGVLPRVGTMGTTRHRPGRGFSESADEDFEEDVDVEMSRSQRTMPKTMAEVRGLAPRDRLIDDRLVVPIATKAKSLRPGGDGLWMDLPLFRRSRGSGGRTELRLFSPSYSVVARSELLQTAGLTSRLTFALFSALEDSAVAVLQKAKTSLRLTFFLACNGETLWTIQRVAPHSFRVFWGNKIRRESLRFVLYVDEKSVFLQKCDFKSGAGIVLGDTVMRCPAESGGDPGSLSTKTARVGVGMDVILVMACLTIADFASPRSWWLANDVDKARADNAVQTKYVRDLLA